MLKTTDKTLVSSLRGNTVNKITNVEKTNVQFLLYAESLKFLHIFLCDLNN